MDEVLLYFSLKYGGDFDRQYQALQSKEPCDRLELEMMRSRMNCNYITILDDRYPEALKKINYPPFVIFYKGDLELLDTNIVSMVGMRYPSEYGIGKADEIASYLANRDITVISGLANGIDTIAHESCIRNGGNTIAVMPCGIENCYPSANKELYDELCKNHLVISEYPFDIKPRKDYFPKRNRLITGLSEKLLVVECDRKGGSMISVGFALEQDKDVLCVPHMMGEKDGCNYLISLGATPLLETSDLLRIRGNADHDKTNMLEHLTKDSRKKEINK